MKLKKCYTHIFKALLLFSWCYLIYYLSSEPLSISATRSLGIVKILRKLIASEYLFIIAFVVRKLAHFSEYFILAFLTYNFIKDFNVKYKVFIILIFCLVYASLDEVHQYFVPGRVMSIIDILIDFLGSLTAMYIISKFDKNIGL